jgi:hypothetical protein
MRQSLLLAVLAFFPLRSIDYALVKLNAVEESQKSLRETIDK